jgi:hypothetical protein
LNPGLLTCGASTLPLSYNPDSTIRTGMHSVQLLLERIFHNFGNSTKVFI